MEGNLGVESAKYLGWMAKTSSNTMETKQAP
jgi:hypothetical protein